MARMTVRILILTLLLCLAPAAWAQEQAFTNRSTELKDKAAESARTLATLPENTEVKVIARGGAWTNVQAGGQAGWVRVFHLRFPAVVTSSSSSSSGGFLGGLTGMLGGGQGSKQATIATTGIRGLSPEDLQNASPDPQALATMKGYRCDKPAAERFAHDGKLVAQNVDTPSEGKRR
jgi:hypothetical protein